MALQGLLSQLELSILLQTLRMEEQDGILRLSRGEDKVNLYLTRGGVRYLAPEPENYTDLLEVLLRHRILRRDQIDGFQKRAKEANLPLGELLVQEGWVTDEHMQNIIAPFFAEKLFSLFDWTDGEFRFEPGPPQMELEFFHPEGSGLSVTFDINFLNLELVRRRDEWSKFRQIIPSDDCIFVLNEALLTQRPYQKEEFSKETRKILHLLDGKKNVADLCEYTGFSKFATYEILYDLYTKQIIQPLDVRYIVEEAEQLYQEERFFEAKQRYKAAIRIHPHNIRLRLAFAKRCLEIEDKEEAAIQFASVAELMARQGKVQEAEQLFQRALSLCAHQQEVKKLYVNFLLEHGSDEHKTWVLVQELAQELVNKKEHVRARRLVEAFCHKYPHHIEGKKLLLQLCEETKDRAQKARVLESLGEIFLGAGNYREAYDYYRQLLEIEPHRSTIQQKLKGIEQFITLSHKVAFRKFVWGAIYLWILAALGFLSYLYIIYTSANLTSKEARKISQEVALLERQALKVWAGSNPLTESEKLEKECIRLAHEVGSLLPTNPGLYKTWQKLERIAQKLAEGKSTFILAERKKNYELLKKALSKEKEHKWKEAYRLYEKVLSSRHNFPTVINFSKERLEFLKLRLEKLKEHLLHLQKLAESGKYTQALKHGIQFYNRYHHHGLAEALRLPLYLETLPPRAKVELVTVEEKGYTTPCTILYPLGVPVTLKVHKKGFQVTSFSFQVSIQNGKLQAKIVEPPEGMSPKQTHRSLEQGKLQISLKNPPQWELPTELQTARVAPPFVFGLTRKAPYQLIALDTGRGKKLSHWALSEQGVDITLQKSAEDEHILYVASGRKLQGLAFKAKDFQLLWSHTFGRTIQFLSSSVSFTRRLALADDEGTLTIVNVQNGEEIRSYPTYSNLCGPPQIWRELVAFGCRDGRIYLQKLDGGGVWQKDLATLLIQPVLFDGTYLITATEGGWVYCFYPAKQLLLWKVRVSDLQSITLLPQHLLITAKQKLMTRKLEDGRAVWEYSLPSTSTLPKVSYQKPFLFLATKEKGWLYHQVSPGVFTPFWYIPLSHLNFTPPFSVSPHPRPGFWLLLSTDTRTYLYFFARTEDL